MPTQRVIIAVPMHRKLGSGGRRIRDMLSQCQLWQPDTPLHPSKMKVTSIVTRYSSILPFFTLAFSSITCRPVIPRKELLNPPLSAQCIDMVELLILLCHKNLDVPTVTSQLAGLLPLEASDEPWMREW